MERSEAEERPARELYALLHLSPEASDEDMKRAYRHWAQVYHPDKHQTAQVPPPPHPPPHFHYVFMTSNDMIQRC